MTHVVLLSVSLADPHHDYYLVAADDNLQKMQGIVNGFDAREMLNAGYDGPHHKQMWQVDEVAEQPISGGKNIIVRATSVKPAKRAVITVCMKLFEEIDIYTLEHVQACAAWTDAIRPRQCTGCGK